MVTSPFTLMKGDYFTGLTRYRIIRWLRVQDPAICRHAIQQKHLTPLALLRHALRAATGMRYVVFQPVLTRDTRLEMERRLFPSCLPALRGLGVGGMTTRTILRRGCVPVTHRDAVRLCGAHAPARLPADRPRGRRRAAVVITWGGWHNGGSAA